MRAILLDCGDVLVDEGTEVKANGVALRVRSSRRSSRTGGVVAHSLLPPPKCALWLSLPPLQPAHRPTLFPEQQSLCGSCGRAVTCSDW